jgi:hypothetical protein
MSASRRDRRDSIAEPRYRPREVAAGRGAIAELTLFVIAPACRPGSRKRGRGGRQREGEHRGYACQNRHTRACRCVTTKPHPHPHPHPLTRAHATSAYCLRPRGLASRSNTGPTGPKTAGGTATRCGRSPNTARKRRAERIGQTRRRSSYASGLSGQSSSVSVHALIGAVEIRALEPDDEPRVVELLQRAFGCWPRGIEGIVPAQNAADGQSAARQPPSRSHAAGVVGPVARRPRPAVAHSLERKRDLPGFVTTATVFNQDRAD